MTPWYGLPEKKTPLSNMKCNEPWEMSRYECGKCNNLSSTIFEKVGEMNGVDVYQCPVCGEKLERWP